MIQETLNVDEFVQFDHSITIPGTIKSIDSIEIVPINRLIPSGLNVNGSGNSIRVHGELDYAFIRSYMYVDSSNNHKIVYKIEEVPTSYDGLYRYVPPNVNTITRNVVVNYTELVPNPTTSIVEEVHSILQIDIVVRNNWELMNAKVKEVITKGSKY